MNKINPTIYIYHCQKNEGILYHDERIINVPLNDLDASTIDVVLCLNEHHSCRQPIDTDVIWISSLDLPCDDVLTRLYVLAGFKHVKKQFTYKKLISFHSHHKYLYMTYHQKDLKQLGQVIANHQGLSDEKVIDMYERKLEQLFDKKTTRQKRENTLHHMYGYFKNELSKKDKQIYFEAMESYMKGNESYHHVLHILWQFSVRFNQQYLLSQTIFEPYPKAFKQALESLL